LAARAETDGEVPDMKDVITLLKLGIKRSWCILSYNPGEMVK
jgi:hypothetical protein